jgi:hypothetical protein
MSTSSKGTIRDHIDERERSMQTAFPAKVIDYYAATGTAKLEPQFYDVWHIDGRRTTSKSRAAQDHYIDNVPVCFPRSGNWSITFPIVTGSFGLVICTKYSLDVWREAGTASDPGDSRRFTLNGATFHPVNLSPTSSQLEGIDEQYMILSETPANAEFVALANLVANELDAIKTKLAAHKHTGVLAGGVSSGTWDQTYTPGSVAATKVKAE